MYTHAWLISFGLRLLINRVVGVNSNTEAKFFAQVPPAFLELGVKLLQGRRSPLMGDASGRNLCYYIMQGLRSTRDVIGYMALLTLVLLLLPMVAASGCIGLSIFRLLTITRHKQYRDSGADNSKANVLRALIFFYALVLAQGGLFLIWLCILGYRSVVREQVCSEYHLEGKDGKLIDKYIDRTSSACIKTGVLNTINRKLVSFAIDLLHSEYSEDRISGVQVLHTLTSIANKTHSEGAIAHIQSSPDYIARMLVLLSSKSGIDENSKVNLALIVTKISKELRLRDIDGATESISSLIDPYLTKISTPAGSVSNVSQQGTSQSPNIQNGQNNNSLIIHGLKILAKLAGNNPDNCTKIFSTKDLFPKIIAPISKKLYTVFNDDESEIAIEITEKSLRVVSKLVKGTHDINREIRHEICGKGLVVDIIRSILKLEQRYSRLKAPAIKILSQLALVNIVGNDADAMVNYIQHLMGLLFDESDDGIKKAAAKALVLLAADSSTTRIINWSRWEAHSVVVKQLSRMLSVPRRSDHPIPSYRNAVAQLLTQFCVNSTDDETRKHLESILHKVTLAKSIYRR